MDFKLEHKSISLADQIFDKLENDILVGIYNKGEVITELKLSEQLGVSRTPIREALRRLEQENIISMTTKGAMIIGISPDDIEAIYEIRERIEGYAARRAATMASEEEIKALADIVDLQGFYIQKEDAQQIMDCDSKFHRALYSMSNSVPLYSTLTELHKKVIKFRRVSVEMSERAKSSYGEHRAIYEAIASHNGDLSEALTTEHVKNARESIRKKIEAAKTKTEA